VVDVYMQMPDPWRHVERACPEHDMHVLRTILDPDDAMGQSCGKRRGVHNQFGWGLVLDGDVWGAPPTSHAICAKAFVASATPLAAAARRIRPIGITQGASLNLIRIVTLD
jgi:hypothetical protein